MQRDPADIHSFDSEATATFNRLMWQGIVCRNCDVGWNRCCRWSSREHIISSKIRWSVKRSSNSERRVVSGAKTPQWEGSSYCHCWLQRGHWPSCGKSMRRRSVRGSTCR